jgi:Putative binding domain, N-terminal
MSAAGGNGTVTLTTSRECQWTAATTATWLHLSTASGQGSGTIAIQIEPNRSTSSRSAALIVGDQRAQVSQQPAGCPISPSPASIEAGSEGGEFHLSISTEDFCSWTITSPVAWVKPSITSGSGNADVTLHIDSNTSAARTANLALGSAVVTINQGSSPSVPVPTCQVEVSPKTASVAAAGGSLAVAVSASQGCSWTATSNQNWISIAQGASGSGTGTIQLNVLQNTGAARAGSVTVAGTTVSVTQAAAATCSFTINPTSFSNVATSGGNATVTVTTTAGCAWTATGAPNWVAINPSSGTGTGTITVTVQSNSGVPRSATLTIAGQSFTVSQTGTCSYTINPTSFLNVLVAGGTTSVSVTTTSGCAWTVTGNPTWVTANPTSGTGSASTSIAVQANTGAVRSTSFQIAGQTFSLSQLPASCTYTVNPTTFHFSNSEHTQAITVTTEAGCSSSATVNVGWIQITATPAPGGGKIAFHVDKNDGPSRTGVITVTGQSFSQNVSVMQDAK